MAKIGITRDLFLLPLVDAIMRSQIEHPFQVVEQSAPQNCQDLIEKTLDIAFITPIDYAKHSSNLSIVKDIAVFSEGPCKYALLVFKENLPYFREVGFAGKSQYQVLTSVVLKEFYQAELEWRFQESLEGNHDEFSSYLLDGDAALENYQALQRFLDIAEEWSDKAEARYFHQLLAVRKGEDAGQLLETLALAREVGIRNVTTIAKAVAATNGNTWDFYHELFDENFRYFPDAAAWGDLSKYFEYLYYHGVLDEIPELHF